MNKRIVNEYIPIAIEALNSNCCHIREKDSNVIAGTYRSAISSFGAAITMGSFKSAVAFFCDNGSSTINRSELMRAIYFIVHGKEWKTAKEICTEIIAITDESKLNEEKEAFINASIALKLAMNAFTLKK